MTIRHVVGMVALVGAMPLVAVGACGTSADPEAVVQAQVEAYNRHDLDAFAACYADDVTITDLSGKTPTTKGIAALRVRYARVATMPTGAGVDIARRTVNGPIVVDVEHPKLQPKDGPPRPDSLLMYEVRDGKILNVWFPPK